MRENIKKNNKIIREFKDKYYFYYTNKNDNSDSTEFQMAIVCLAIFMSILSLVCKFMNNSAAAVISYVSAISLAMVPVIIGVVKLYILGEKRIHNLNRIEALNKTFVDYLGKDCGYSRQLQLIDALIESYSKSSEGIWQSIVKIIMYVLIQIDLLSLSLLSGFVNWEKIGMNGDYIWSIILTNGC